MHAIAALIVAIAVATLVVRIERRDDSK